MLDALYALIFQAAASEPAQAVETPPQQTEMAAPQPEPERERMVCRTENETGSRVRRQRVCRTEAEAAAVRRTWGDLINRSGQQPNDVRPGGGDGPG